MSFALPIDISQLPPTTISLLLVLTVALLVVCYQCLTGWCLNTLTGGDSDPSSIAPSSQGYDTLHDDTWQQPHDDDEQHATHAGGAKERPEERDFRRGGGIDGSALRDVKSPAFGGSGGLASRPGDAALTPARLEKLKRAKDEQAVADAHPGHSPPGVYSCTRRTDGSYACTVVVPGPAGAPGAGAAGAGAAGAGVAGATAAAGKMLASDNDERDAEEGEEGEEGEAEEEEELLDDEEVLYEGRGGASSSSSMLHASHIRIPPPVPVSVREQDEEETSSMSDYVLDEEEHSQTLARLRRSIIDSSPGGTLEAAILDDPRSAPEAVEAGLLPVRTPAPATPLPVAGAGACAGALNTPRSTVVTGKSSKATRGSKVGTSISNLGRSISFNRGRATGKGAVGSTPFSATPSAAPSALHETARGLPPAESAPATGGITRSLSFSRGRKAKAGAPSAA